MSSIDGEVLALHAALQDLDANSPSQTARILSLLQAASKLRMSHALLKSIPIGKTVGLLRKSNNASVARLAISVVAEWKKLLPGPEELSIPGETSHASSSSAVPLNQFLLSDGNGINIVHDLYTDANVSFLPGRARVLHKAKGGRETAGHVVYWMSRDQRINDNWALLHAQQLAISKDKGLAIVFCLSSSFLGANKRHFGFMLRGLKELEVRAAALNIPLFILCGQPKDVLPQFAATNQVSTIVCDFSPLRIAKEWRQELIAVLESSGADISLVEVDAHNVAPCVVVSNKCEFSAKTIRNKIHIAMDQYLTEFPPVRAHPHKFTETGSAAALPTSWEYIVSTVVNELDGSVDEIDWVVPGETSAIGMMRAFLPRLKKYGEDRNDPSIDNGVSHLSPFFHFGQLSVQRVLLEIMRTYKCGRGALFPSGERTSGIHSFAEEAVVRKELSDNFCYYNPNYDSIDGAHSWAQSTLGQHWADPREVLYSLEQLEGATTGDRLWNAAQQEMVARGKMHGFMRMYWAKKILEWSPDPAEALRRAIYLNDKYSIDGRDPNGYVGCMWAIAGVHDRAWGRRPVFGTIRYMNYEGCKRKFNIEKYITKCGKYISRSDSKMTSSIADSEPSSRPTKKQRVK